MLFGGNEKTLVLAEDIYRVQDYYNNEHYYVTELRKGNTIDEGSKALVDISVISNGSPQNPITLELIAADGTVYQSLELYGNSIPVSFHSIPLGSYTLKLSKAGHLSYETPIEVEDIYDIVRVSATLKLPSISGTVTGFGNENDTVTVELWKKDGTSAEETYFSKGNTVYYSFNGNGNGLDSASEYYVVVKKNLHKDYRTYDINFSSVAEQKVDIALTLEYITVSGSIKFEESAVTPTISFIEDTKFDADIKEASLVLSESGAPTNYFAYLLPATRYIMTATAEGYQTYIAYITTGFSPIAYDISFVKDTGKLATVSGKVTSAGNDAAPITVTLTLNGTSEPAYEAVVNGNDAYYAFTDVTAGIYTLKAVKAGHSSWSTSIIIGYDELRRDIKLTKIAGSYVGGTATSHGNSEDAVTIWLVRDGEDIPAYETTVYGNTSDYGFYGVENGEYTLIALKNGHLPYLQSVTVENSDISADATLYLVGDVNGDGEVDIRDLVRLKKITVSTAQPAGGTTADLNGDGKNNAEDIIVLKKMLLDVQANQGVTLSGKVTSTGDENAEIKIQLIPDEATEPAYEVTVKGNSTAYSIDNIQRGSYTLRAIKNNNVTREYSLVIGTADATQDITLYSSQA